jgi:hypothetical protein
MGYNENYSPRINLDDSKMGSESGFITMGDNNAIFDQPNAVPGVNGLITYDNVRAVAWIEVPWVGAFKLMMNGDMLVVDTKVPNTVPCLVAAILLIVFLLVSIGFLNDHRYYTKYRKELYDEFNAPTPILPVEKKNK